jgi:dihydroflavonol-4-reductase
MRRILTADMPGIPDVAFGSVDVRDVAAAHIFAFEKPNTDGKRYILVQGTHHWKVMLKILEGEFGKYGYKFPSMTVGSFLMKIVSWFDSEVKAILPMVGREIRFNNTPSIEELGIKYIDIRKSLIEMAYRMIKMGSVPNKLPK